MPATTGSPAFTLDGADLKKIGKAALYSCGSVIATAAVAAIPHVQFHAVDPLQVLVFGSVVAAINTSAVAVKKWFDDHAKAALQ